MKGNVMNVDLALIYPPFSVEERYARKVGRGIGGNLPPLGIASLAAWVREKGFSVGLFDAIALRLSDEDLVGRVQAAAPRVIGFSALTGNFHRAAACAKKLRDRFPDVLIVIGGHHATIAPVDALGEAPGIDLAVIGEGERPLLELLTRYREAGWQRSGFLENRSRLDELRGIAYRSGDGVVVTPPGLRIENLDSLPFPARDLLPMQDYLPLPNQYLRKPVVHMTAIRGCPFACSFCSNNAVFGRTIRCKSPARVVEEIAHVMERYGAREISFWDDTMTANRDWMIAFCDELLRRRLDITWTGYARANTVDLPLLRKMKQAGCWNLFYGFEAGDQQLLDNVGKGIPLETMRQAAKWTQEAGIEVRGSFMLALPGETPELARKTIRFAIELDVDYAQFCITTPYPGTRLWKEAETYGRLRRDFPDYHCWSPVFVPRGYRDEDEILDMERTAVRQFYCRPAFVWKCLRKIHNGADLMRYLKGLRMLAGFLH